MKLYKDLNLDVIRDEIGLDFAHYTYLEGMTSLDNSPEDFDDEFWNKDSTRMGAYSFVLFKNSDDLEGHVTPEDTIEDETYIEYYFDDEEQQEAFCYMLQEQLGDKYEVLLPGHYEDCIQISYIG